MKQRAHIVAFRAPMRHFPLDELRLVLSPRHPFLQDYIRFGAVSPRFAIRRSTTYRRNRVGMSLLSLLCGAVSGRTPGCRSQNAPNVYRRTASPTTGDFHQACAFQCLQSTVESVSGKTDGLEHWTAQPKTFSSALNRRLSPDEQPHRHRTSAQRTQCP